MDFRYLYSSTSGRISRKTFWWGAVGLLVSGAVVSLLLGIATVALASSLVSDRSATTGVMLVGFVAISVLLSYPAYCLAVKRRHDRNSRGLDIMFYIGLNLALNVGLVLMMVGGNIDIVRSPPVMFASYALQGLGIYALIVLGFLKGTAGTNDYGPDPLLGATATA